MVAGGTGQYAVQLAKGAGNHVVGTCGTPEKAEFLQSLGCDRVINYRQENVKQVLRDEYPDGIDLIYESVGGALFDTCVRALARRGRLLIIGFISEYVEGPQPVRQPRIYAHLLTKSASLRAFFLPHFSTYYHEHARRLFQLIGEGKLHGILAGGTGQYAVQLAKRAGNHVVGTCGTPEKAEFLQSLGCDRVINYREENVKQVLRDEYPDGIDLIYESVGGALFDTCVRALALHGRLIIIGFISEYVEGPQPVRQPRIYAHLLMKSASVRAFFLPHFSTYYREHARRLFQLIGEGKLHVAIDPTEFHGLDAVTDAVEYLHSGQSMGKIVVRL